MKKYFYCFIFIAVLFSSSVSVAVTFDALGKKIDIEFPNDICPLNGDAPVESYLFEMMKKSAPPKYTVKIGYIGCSTLNNLKSDIDDEIDIYGQVKVFKEKISIPTEQLFFELKKKFNAKDKSKKLLENNLKKSYDILNVPYDFSVNEVDVIEEENNALYIGTKVQQNSKLLNIVSCFTVIDDTLMIIELTANPNKYTPHKSSSFVQRLKNQIQENIFQNK